MQIIGLADRVENAVLVGTGGRREEGECAVGGSFGEGFAEGPEKSYCGA